jgi:hypothetical protein
MCIGIYHIACARACCKQAILFYKQNKYFHTNKNNTGNHKALSLPLERVRKLRSTTEQMAALVSKYDGFWKQIFSSSLKKTLEPITMQFGLSAVIRDFTFLVTQSINHAPHTHPLELALPKKYLVIVCSWNDTYLNCGIFYPSIPVIPSAVL